MSANQRTRDELKRILVETLGIDVPPDQIGDDEPLFESGMGVDSVEALALMSAIEKRFDIVIPDDEIGIALFQDIRTLAEVVDRIAAARGGAR
ncbi:Acyl carrier protein [Minicystis rosea]|nr:Acyl carrier protein [Minicystis rosea]